MESLAHPPCTGLQAFELLPEGTRCQLINDSIIMSPTLLVPHALIKVEIAITLYNYVKENKAGIVMFTPIDVYMNQTNVYQPDIIFVSNEIQSILKKRGVFGAPDLVIELLSEDRKYDLVTKKAVYEKTGVKEYWVIDPETKWCEGFQLSDGKYTSLGESTGNFTIALLNLAIDF